MGISHPGDAHLHLRIAIEYLAQKIFRMQFSRATA
jgi:hypothetical protein